MYAVTLALILLALTCFSSLAQRVVKLPLPLVQILVGIIAALPPFGLHVAFDPHAFLLLFIPPLLFSDGWRMPRRELKALRWPLLGNAVVLVLITVLVGGYGLHWLIPEMPLSVAFAVAAVVSPTDAVAFGAITERIAVPARLAHLLESEALLNDASGLVALRFALAATLTGSFSLLHASGNFLLIALGGLAIGVVITLAFARLVRLLDVHDTDAPVQAVLSVLLPFAAYWLAERADVSGILAAVGAGVAANRAGLLERAHFSARMQSGSMWRLIVYCFNGIIFVLLGMQLPGIIGPEPGGLDLVTGTQPLRVLVEILALTGMLIVVRLVWALFSITVERLLGLSDHFADWRVVLAASLGGVRGAITLAGVLTIPLVMNDGTPFPSRDLAITLATGVILMSLVIASVALPLLLAHVSDEGDGRRGETHTARLAAMQAAIKAIHELPGEPDDRREAILHSYNRRLTVARERDDNDDLEDEEDAWRDLHTVALQAERIAIHAMRESMEINDETAREVIAEIDLQEAASMRRPLRMRPVRAIETKT